MPPVRNSVPIATGILGFLALLVVVSALQRPVLEQWYIWRLTSENEADRKVAARRLVAMKSERAIPGLIEILKENPYSVVDLNDEEMSAFRPTIESYLEKVPEMAYTIVALGYSADALVSIGLPAVPALTKVVHEDGEEQVRSAATEALKRVQGSPGEARSGL